MPEIQIMKSWLQGKYYLYTTQNCVSNFEEKKKELQDILLDSQKEHWTLNLLWSTRFFPTIVNQRICQNEGKKQTGFLP